MRKYILFLFTTLLFSCSQSPKINTISDLIFSPDAEWQQEIKGNDAVFEWKKENGEDILVIQSENGADAQLYQDVTLEPDQIYRLSGYIKTTDLENGHGAVICLYDTWINTEKLIGSNDWKKYVITFQTPEDGKIQIACRIGFTGLSTGVAEFKNLKLEKLDLFELESEYIRLRIDHEDAAVVSKTTLENWLANMDKVYLQYYDLIGMKPFDGQRITVLAVEQYPWGWAVAGNPILWHKRYVPSSLKNIEDRDDWSFGIMHEISHDFNAAEWAIKDVYESWNWNEEMFANFRMYYAVENLNGKFIQGDILYTGAEAKLFYKSDGSGSYDKTFPKGEFSHDALMFTLIRIKDVIGWQPFIDTFKWLYTNKTELTNDWDKFNLFLDKLEEFSDTKVRFTYLDGELDFIQKNLMK